MSGARAGLAAAALAALSLAAPAQAQHAAERPIRQRTAYEDMQLFSQVLNQIRVNHPDSVDTHELLMAAIEGMVHAADPHSFVIPAVRLNPEKEKARREGKLYPVPITFAYVDGAPVVVSVAPGSSAAQADIFPGDELLAIDTHPVAAQSADELDLALAGEKQSRVTLTFERRRSDGSLVQLDRTVQRERVGEATAVPAAFLLDAQTGYVRITTFEGSQVADDLHDALGRLEKRGMRRLLLDLRGNGGGSVDEAAHVAGEFLPKGAVVYTAEGRKADVTDTGRVHRSFWKSEKSYPIVLMINSGTASASELVAGALQDHDRALIVGHPSFGKSLLMEGFPLADGSVIMLVVGRLRTPCGRIIQRQYQGITRRDYFRLARAARDTTGRPSCRTDGGRTVYGGGGIYPDIVLPERPPVPVWASRLGEQAIPLKWIGGYMAAHGSEYTSLDTLAAHPVVGAGVIADFRRYAGEQGVPIPPGAAADRLVERLLVRLIADAKWGDEGYYRLVAVLDPDVAAALAALDRASMLTAAK